MRKLDWRLSPEEFVRALAQWRLVWRRRGGGGLHGKRLASDLARRRARWYLGLRGGHLPPLPFAGELSGAWSAARPDDLKIVVLPQLLAGAAERVENEAEPTTRKRFRRTFRSVAEDGQILELLNAGRARRHAVPTIGRGMVSGRSVSRGVVLEAIGAVILPDLTATQVKALEARGALVLENQLIEAVDPVDASDTVAKAVGPDAAHLLQINIQAAREKGLRGAGALIGIADTGIDPGHPEFTGKVVHFRSILPNGELDADQSARDFGRHGTHVAALCAGATKGVAPDAELAVAAVLTTKKPDGTLGGYLGQVLIGMDWLALGGAGLPRPVDVLNASLSVPGDANDYMVHSGYRDNGVLVVAAIGNRGGAAAGNHTAPARYDCTIGVGAVDGKGIVADFSAWGGAFSHPAPSTDYKPDMVAPGVQLVSAVPGAKYAPMTGTSMATPLVSGAAALLIGRDQALKGDAYGLKGQVLALTKPLGTQPNHVDVRRSGVGCLDLTAI